MSWRGDAFGLDIDSSFGLVGCDGSDAVAARPLPRVQLQLAPRAELAAAVPARASDVIARRPGPSGRLVPEVRAHDSQGYLLVGAGFGLFHVSRDGAVARCAPVAIAAWRWQRYLIGQVLPFVSALRGYETLHAGAVAVDGGAVAVTAASGRGKSSLLVRLVAEGARFFADDVVAVEARGGRPLAHPGTGLVSLRPDTLERLGSDVSRLGRIVGRDRSGVRLAVARHDGPLSLRALYRLQAAAGDHTGRVVHSPPDPRALLGSTYNAALLTPDRLRAQLDVCAAVARCTRVVDVPVTPSVDFRTLARELLDDARAAPAPAAVP